MDEKGLGKRLQQARRSAGLTQQALCQKANISYSTLAKIERGAIKAPSIFTIQNLVLAMGSTLDELMGTALPTAPEGSSSTSKNGIKFVYFDVNGCLVHLVQHAFTCLAQDAGVSYDSVDKAFWHLNDAACRGDVTMDEFNQQFASRIGIPSLDWLSYYIRAVEPVRGMDEAVRWAAGHYPVGLLTNTMPGFLQALRDYGKIPDITYATVIDSSQVKAIKPEATIFQIAVEQAAVQPHEILFIDDDHANLIAAEKHGWQTLHCDDFNTEQTIAAIHQMLELA